MRLVVFYEKPGCVGNARQKALLLSQRVELEVRSLPDQAWTAARLRPYFGAKAVSDWFNKTAPQVKSGQITIDKLSEGKAIDLMIENPLLIRRPLMRYGDLRQSGFDPGPVLDQLGIALDQVDRLGDCPMTDTAVDCEVPR